MSVTFSATGQVVYRLRVGESIFPVNQNATFVETKQVGFDYGGFIITRTVVLVVVDLGFSFPRGTNASNGKVGGTVAPRHTSENAVMPHGSRLRVGPSSLPTGLPWSVHVGVSQVLSFGGRLAHDTAWWVWRVYRFTAASFELGAGGVVAGGQGSGSESAFLPALVLGGSIGHGGAAEGFEEVLFKVVRGGLGGARAGRLRGYTP